MSNYESEKQVVDGGPINNTVTYTGCVNLNWS